MRDPDYIIGTGYHSRHHSGDALAWFFDLWQTNTLKYSDPHAIYVIASGDGRIPTALDKRVNWISSFGDLGHCGDLISGRKPYHFAAGPMVWMTLAMLAYLNECDFIYKEQDLLMFGPCIETMYRQIGTHGCIFGSSRSMGTTQSLALIRHRFIPEVIRLYLGTPHERDPNQVGEAKFSRLQSIRSDLFCRYSFGVDRDRPFDVNAPVWYAQKFTGEELQALAAAGLIELHDMPTAPSGPKTFSNM